MLGAIMPEPFAMPATTKPFAWTAMNFGLVSVVIIASTADNPAFSESDNSPFTPFIADSIFAMGICFPIMPVEPTIISFSEMPSSFARSFACILAFFNPSFPVPAFATPETTLNAWHFPCVRRSRPRMTGGACAVFCVKTAAMAAGTSEATTQKSLRLDLMPANFPTAFMPFTQVMPFPSKTLKLAIFITPNIAIFSLNFRFAEHPKNQRILCMHAVLRLVENNRLGRINDFVCHLIAAVRGQAVHEKSAAKNFLCHLERLVLLVLFLRIRFLAH